MVNRGGKKFHPREIEEILYTHPKVLHAAIVGIDDRRLGERNCLCLIPRPGEEPELGEFVDLLRDRVATYKLPEVLEVFEAFPFTPTGKVQRHELARMIAERSYRLLDRCEADRLSGKRRTIRFVADLSSSWSEGRPSTSFCGAGNEKQNVDGRPSPTMTGGGWRLPRPPRREGVAGADPRPTISCQAVDISPERNAG